jgi:hypothetical protein
MRWARGPGEIPALGLVELGGRLFDRGDGSPPGIAILTMRSSLSVRRSAKSRSLATSPLSRQRATSRVRATTSRSTSSNRGCDCSLVKCSSPIAF